MDEVKKGGTDSDSRSHGKTSVYNISMFILIVIASITLAILILLHIITGILIFSSENTQLLEDNVGSYVRYSDGAFGIGNNGTLGGFAIVSNRGRIMAQITIITIKESGRTARTVNTFFLDSWDLDTIEVLEPMFAPKD